MELELGQKLLCYWKQHERKYAWNLEMGTAVAVAGASLRQQTLVCTRFMFHVFESVASSPVSASQGCMHRYRQGLRGLRGDNYIVVYCCTRSTSYATSRCYA